MGILTLLVTLGLPVDDAIGAHAACEPYIERQLSHPESAQFPRDHLDDRVSQHGEAWIIRSYVESENRLGANVIQNWECVVAFEGGEWRVLDFTLYTGR